MQFGRILKRVELPPPSEEQNTQITRLRDEVAELKGMIRILLQRGLLAASGEDQSTTLAATHTFR